MPGIANGANGVVYSTTEIDGRSNTLINWGMSSGERAALRERGTSSLWAYADVDNSRAGEMIGESNGYNTFRNGQGTFSSHLSRYDGGDGLLAGAGRAARGTAATARCIAGLTRSGTAGGERLDERADVPEIEHAAAGEVRGLAAVQERVDERADVLQVEHAERLGEIGGAGRGR